jgi:hypothetical protein
MLKSGIYNKFVEMQTSEPSLNIPHSLLNEDLNGISHGMMIGVVGENKSGKTKFTDYTFIVGLILENPNANITIDKYSLEVNLIENIANFTSIIINYYENYELDPNVILGRKKDANKNKVNLTQFELDLIEKYLPLLHEIVGEYDNQLNLVKPGKVNIITEITNPTGIYKDAKKKALKYGEIEYTEYVVDGIKKKKPLRYLNTNNTYMICVVDDSNVLYIRNYINVLRNIGEL